MCKETNLCNAERKHKHAVVTEAVTALVDRTRRQRTKNRDKDRTGQYRTGRDRTIQVIGTNYNFPNALNHGLRLSVARLRLESL